MNPYKLSLVMCLVVVAGSANGRGNVGRATIKNLAPHPIFFVLVQTKVGLKGLTHPQDELYSEIYIAPEGERLGVLPGSTVEVEVPPRDATKYDRVLYIVDNSDGSQLDALEQALKMGNKRNRKLVSAVELGSKKQLIIDKKNGKYVAVPPSTSVQAQLDVAWKATKQAFGNVGERVGQAAQVSSEEIRAWGASQAQKAGRQWDAVKGKFKTAYQAAKSQLTQATQGARRSLFGKSKADIEQEVEGEGERGEGWGEVSREEQAEGLRRSGSQLTMLE